MMMDEDWARQWDGARYAAQRARAARLAEATRTGQRAPSLWNDLRALVRDLINPPERTQASGKTPAARDCQSSA